MLLLVACSNAKTSKTGEVETESASDSEGINAEDADAENANEERANLKFKTMKAVMASGIPYKCDFEMDGIKSTTTIKGEKAKTVIEHPQGKTTSVSDGEKMYMWTDDGKMAIMFDIKEMEKIGKEQMNAFPGVEKQQAIDYKKEYDLDCSQTIASDSMFVPSPGIKFTDMTQMMKNMQETLANLQNLPNVEYN